MDNRHVLITGVSRGIGAAIATQLAGQGYQVIGVSRSEPKNFPGRFYAADLSEEKTAKAILAEIAAEFKVLRLVHNAGLVAPASIEDATDAEFDATIRLNVQAGIWALQATVPNMKAASFGRVVMIGSRAGLGKATRLIYSASKAAILGLTRSAALELASHGITVNNVAPGPIETELFAANLPPGSPEREAFVANVPMHRMGQPEEVAAAAAYFLSDEAGFTTGQTLYVCGGLGVTGPV